VEVGEGTNFRLKQLIFHESDLFELISESKKRGNGLIKFLEKVEARGKLAISKGAKFPSAGDYHVSKPPRKH